MGKLASILCILLVASCSAKTLDTKTESKEFTRILNMNYTNKDNDIDFFLSASMMMLSMIEKGKGKEISPMPPIPSYIILSNPDASAALMIRGLNVYMYTYNGAGDVALSMSSVDLDKFIEANKLK